jgi:hypothetical protein
MLYGRRGRWGAKADDGYLTPFLFLDPLIFSKLSQSLTLFTPLEI